MVTRANILERIEKSILSGETKENCSVCDDVYCDECEMFDKNELTGICCKALNENLFDKVERKFKLKKLLS